MAPAPCPRKTQYAHQPLHAFAVDLVPQAAQVLLYLAATVKRMPRVFGINQRQQRQFLLVRFCSHMWRINRGTCHTCQFALPGQRQGFDGAHPLTAVFYGLIPDFFLSQSSSIFNRPISEYSSEGLADGSVGFGPRLVSNRLDACSCSSFFHKPTCVGCTPNSWPQRSPS